jgi:Uma2 family endonuclease
MLVSMLDPDQVDVESIRPISRAEYHRMVDAGILGEDEHIELLRGIIVTKSPMKWHHAAVVSWLTERLILQLAGRLEVRPQLPYAADEWSEPEPDILVTTKDRARRDHPSEALLIIEVAESSLRRDRRIKATIYAEAGVPEYWIIDLKAMAVEVHTSPADGGYESVVTLRDGDVLRPTQLSGVELAIAEMPR